MTGRIMGILEELKAEPSKNAKLEILRKHEDDELLQRVFRMALDPRINYFIKKIPEHFPSIEPIELEEALDRLEALSSRRVTGNDAIKHLKDILSDCGVNDGETIERVIKGKLDCGVSEGSINKVWKGLIFTHPVMLASSQDEKTLAKFKFPAYAQLKADGARVNVIVNKINGVHPQDDVYDVAFYSRNGKKMIIENENIINEFISLAKINEEIGGGLSGIMFDGEILIALGDDVEQRTTSNGIILKAIEGTISEDESKLIRISIWDIIDSLIFIPTSEPINRDSYEVQYSKRFTRLEKLFAKSNCKYVSLIENHIVTSLDEAKKVFHHYLRQGKEGIILKTMDGIWENKRVKHMVKFKDEITAEVRITGIAEGTGKHTGLLGAFEVETANGITGKVGSGLSDAQRKEYFTEDMIGKIIEIKYNEIVGNKKDDSKSFFLPIFVAYRHDKTEPDTIT